MQFLYQKVVQKIKQFSASIIFFYSNTTLLSNRKRSNLDNGKTFLYANFDWITIAVVCISGTYQISLFCIGYLICFFYLLKNKTALVVGPVKKLLKVYKIVLSQLVSYFLVPKPDFYDYVVFKLKMRKILIRYILQLN